MSAPITRTMGDKAFNSRIRFIPEGGSGSGSGSGGDDSFMVVAATNLVEMPRFSVNEAGGSGSGSGSGSTGIGGSHGVRVGQQVRVTATAVRMEAMVGTIFTFSYTPTPLKAKITNYQTMSGITHRWKYTWTEQRIVKAGRWEDRPDGFSSTPVASGDPTIYAYNQYEANNGDTGVQGNSIDITNLPSSYGLAPVRGSPVVDLYGWTNCDGEHEEHFFYPNAIQGECPA